MSFKLKPLNHKYMTFIKSFNDKKKYYISLIWIRFMRRVKTFGYQVRNKLKWRVVPYCQPLNGYRIDFLTYHTIDAIFRAKVDRKKAEKEKKAAAKKNKKKTTTVTAYSSLSRKERLERMDYINRPEVLNFKLLNNFLKKNKKTETTEITQIVESGVVEGADENDDYEVERPLTMQEKYDKVLNKAKASNKKMVKKKQFFSSKYAHLVNQFFMSKQKNDEGIEIEKTKTFKNLDERLKILIRARLHLFTKYYNKRKFAMKKSSRFYLARKKYTRGFDVTKFRHVDRLGQIISPKKDLKKTLS